VVNVIVLKDGKYGEANLKDLKGKKFGISYEKEKATLNKALAKMEEKIDTQKYIKVDKYTELAEKLYDGSVDAIVVGNEYKSYLEINHEGFDEETRIVASYEFERKSTSATTQVTDVTENSFTVYVTGIDTYGSVSTVSRSDVNLIVNVNPKTKQILMVSIPRDCQINLHKNGKMDKLTHTGIYGVEETVSTIEDFLDVEINYYARTNFSGITNIVDALGGVTIDSDYEFDTLHGGYHIVKGKQHMDGDKALCFVRERYSLPSGDFDRGRNQQKLLKAMLEKAMSPKIITNFENILSAIEGCFETDMSSREIRSLINMQLDDMADWDVFNVQITGEGYMTSKTYSMSGTNIYVMKPYASKVKQIKKLINKIHDGKVIKKADVKGLTGDPNEGSDDEKVDEE
ncbi:MAG: LCP family protein, partial [Faecalibacillus sp.]